MSTNEKNVHKKTKRKAESPSANPGKPAPETGPAPFPSITSSEPLPGVDTAATDQPTIRSASDPTILPSPAENPPAVELKPSKSSDKPPKQHKVHSPTASIGTGSLIEITSLTAQRKPRRHRRSGLFSHDDLSADISASPSFPVVSKLPPAKAISSGEIRKHPVSRAGSSVAMASNSGSGGGAAGDINVTHPNHPHNKYKPFRRKWRRFRRKYKGCIFALISSLTSSIGSYFVHHLTHKTRKNGGTYDATYCLLWRYFGVLFPGIFIVLFYRCIQKEKVFDTILPLKTNYKRFILSCARAVVDVAAVLLNYLAFSYLLQSETSTILNSKPIIVQLLAHFTLGEPWGIVPIIVSIFAALGVMIISKPPFLEGKTTFDNDFTERLKGIGLSVASMLLASVVYVILRYLKDVHYSVFSLFIGSVGLSFALVMTLVRHALVWPDPADIPWLLTVAVFVCFSSIAIVIALQNEEAFVVSLVRSCDVIFSFIWEMTLDQKYPTWYSGGGAAIIMFCVVIIFFRKYLTHQEPEKRIYKIFHFLTK